MPLHRLARAAMPGRHITPASPDSSCTVTHRARLGRRLAAAGLAAMLAAALTACGGGGDEAGAPSDTVPCDAASRKTALRDYFTDWYFWYALSPRPEPRGPASLEDYFGQLLFTGNADFPADRWSYYDSTESHNLRYGAGQTMGWGVSVAGIEVAGRPDLPLMVRYVEPRSPAAAAGVVRGDQVLAVNGRPAAELVAAGDYSSLSAANAGQTIALALQGPAGSRTVNLSAAVFDLTPVTRSQVVLSPWGRRVGYVMVKDMIEQAVAPMGESMTAFRAAGVGELVVDLRYNGGGLVSVARDIASLVAGPRAAGRTFTSLLYNDKRAAANNASYPFTSPAQALGLSRVYLLVGQRTCSASEQLANGLRPFVDVVLVGDTTCGKPVGFLPKDDRCGRTYNVVNFESANALNEGRYFEGLTPTCAVGEDWRQPLGATAEPLLAAALGHADGAACAARSAATRPHALAQRRQALINEGERPAMIPR